MFLRVTEEHLDVEKRKTLGQVDVYLHEERRNFGIKTTPANKFPEFKEARRISSFLASFKILRIMECYLFQFPACFPTVFVLLFHISQTPLRARSGISPKTKLGQLDEYFPGRQRLGTNFDNILKAAIKGGIQKYAWSRFLGGRLWCFRGKGYNSDSVFGRVGRNYVLFWVKRQVAHSAELALPILGWAQIPIITTMTYFLVLVILGITL